jgi:hypothetical protein
MPESTGTSFSLSISEEQLAANRANAALSTGPRTPEGKARSSQNARKHGFTASNFGILAMADLDEIERLKQDLIAAHQPANNQELFALEQIAIAQQSLRRAARMEAGLFMACMHRAHVTSDSTARTTDELTGDSDLTRQQHRNFRLAEGLHKMSRDSNAWSQFLRYQAQAQRKYRFAVQEFENLVMQRDELYNEELQNEPIFDAEVEENEITSAGPETDPFSIGKMAAGL